MSTSSKNNLDRINNSMSNLTFRNYDHNKIVNPQASARSDESRSYGRSVFLTNFDKSKSIIIQCRKQKLYGEIQEMSKNQKITN